MVTKPTKLYCKWDFCEMTSPKWKLIVKLNHFRVENWPFWTKIANLWIEFRVVRTFVSVQRAPDTWLKCYSSTIYVENLCFSLKIPILFNFFKIIYIMKSGKRRFFGFSEFLAPKSLNIIAGEAIISRLSFNFENFDWRIWQGYS